MQQTVAELKDQQASNQMTSTNTGSTESGTVIINNYYTISSTGSTESGFTNHSGSFEWTHSETILAELLGNIGSTGSTNGITNGSTLSGNIITPRDAVLYISELFTNMTDVVHNFVALEITAVHGYFNEIWTHQIHTDELVASGAVMNSTLTKTLCVGTEINKTCITKEQLDILLFNAGQSSNSNNLILSAPPDQAVSQNGIDSSTEE